MPTLSFVKRLLPVIRSHPLHVTPPPQVQLQGLLLLLQLLGLPQALDLHLHPQFHLQFRPQRQHLKPQTQPRYLKPQTQLRIQFLRQLQHLKSQARLFKPQAHLKPQARQSQTQHRQRAPSQQ